jgi:indole-3-glycerol phosphate synthase
LAIYRLLQNSSVQPEEIRRIAAAYERALRTLCVKDRDDPLTEMIAKKIIKIAQSGIKDPAQIATLAIKGLEMR